MGTSAPVVREDDIPIIIPRRRPLTLPKGPDPVEEPFPFRDVPIFVPTNPVREPVPVRRQ